ncbi:hypothetical protein V865_007550 [Kwoniella europaea PYCC6329]|uniref:Uncharacterized protein n=1 Tax=Kwoniella europaea PYCC6329 TaxID=1423913 RepID=A0AAX4KSH9_9TREE
MNESQYPCTTPSAQSNVTHGSRSNIPDTGYEQEQEQQGTEVGATLHDDANEDHDYDSDMWSVDYSEGEEGERQSKAMPIPEDTRVKISLNYDLDSKDRIFHIPPTMIVIEVDWTTTTNRKKKERKPFVDISGYTNTFQSEPNFGSTSNLSKFMSSSHWSKKIDEMYRSVDDNLSDFREIAKSKYRRERHISESMELAVAEMFYSLETEKDKRGDDQIHIRVLTTREAKGLRDNRGYSKWKRRDKIIIS